MVAINLDITPSTDLIEAFRHQNLTWSKVFAELVDNAFDADATQISIIQERNAISIEDNGSGCDDLTVMVAPGKRQQRQSTQLGRYGIGAKDAAIWAADELVITSTCDKTCRSIRVDWKQIEKSGTWKFTTDAIEEPTTDANGTFIRLTNLRANNRHHKEHIKELMEFLSQTYTPAIKSGKQILINGMPVPEYKFPVLEQQASADLDVGGRQCKVTMGLVPDGTVMIENGMWISYGFRFIMRNTRHGLGQEPTPNLFGWIELGKGWQLTKNKENITSGLGNLASKIAATPCFAEIIEKSRKQGYSLAMEQVAFEINRILSDLGTSQKKARRPGVAGEIGAIEPKQTGRKHRRASLTQLGNTFDDRDMSTRCNGLKVSFMNLGEDGPICQYSNGIVSLNDHHPIIIQDRGSRRQLFIHASYAVATNLAFYSQHSFTSMKEENADVKIYRVAATLLKNVAAMENEPRNESEIA